MVDNKVSLGVSKIVVSGESGVYAQCPYISNAYAVRDPALPSLYENDGYFLDVSMMGVLAHFAQLLAAGVPATSRTVNGTCHAGDCIFRGAMSDVYLSTIRDIKSFADSLSLETGHERALVVWANGPLPTFRCQHDARDIRVDRARTGPSQADVRARVPDGRIDGVRPDR